MNKTRFLLINLIRERTDDSGDAVELSNVYLADYCDCHPRTVQRQLRRAKDDGLITADYATPTSSRYACRRFLRTINCGNTIAEPRWFRRNNHSPMRRYASPRQPKIHHSAPRRFSAEENAAVNYYVSTKRDIRNAAAYRHSILNNRVALAQAIAEYQADVAAKEKREQQKHEAEARRRVEANAAADRAAQATAERESAFVADCQNFPAWQIVITSLKAKTSAPTFNCCFANLHPIAFADATLVVSASNAFIKNQIEKSHREILNECICEAFGETVGVKIISKNEGIYFFDRGGGILSRLNT